MRLGLWTSPDRPLVDQARRAERLGFDVLWIDDRAAAGPAPAAALTSAAFLAAPTTTIRVVATVVAGRHPVTLAEESAVADLVLDGRLVLGLRTGDGGADEVAETVAAVQAATSARPFRHEGPRWTIPANRPGATGWVEDRIRVTPTPAQLVLPLWLVGAELAGVAGTAGLPFVPDTGPAGGPADDAVADAWAATEQRLGVASGRILRPAIHDVALVDGRVPVDATAGRLTAARRRWGLDLAVLRLPPGIADDTWSDALETLAHEVRPRVQLDRLPPGTEAFWSEERARQRGDGAP